MAEYFSDGVSARKFTNRRKYVERAQKVVKIFDLDETGLLIWLPENLVYRFENPRLSLLCFKGEKLVWRSGLPNAGTRLKVEEGALEAGTYRIAMDVAGLAEAGADVVTDLSFFLVPDEVIPADGFAGGPLKSYEYLLGTPLLEVPVMSLGQTELREGLDRVGMDGVIERVNDGVLTGWIRDRVSGLWTCPVAFYIDGQFIGMAKPSIKRENLGPPEEKGMVFQIKLPLGYFYEQGRKGVVLDARPVGRNVSLRRSPLPLTGGETFRWSPTEERWIELSNEALLGEVASDG